MKNFSSLPFLIGNLSNWNQPGQTFHQFYAAPLNLNPALTGAMEGSYRVVPFIVITAQGTITPSTFSFCTLRLMPKEKKSTDDAIGLGIAFLMITRPTDFSNYTNFCIAGLSQINRVQQQPVLDSRDSGGLTQRKRAMLRFSFTTNLMATQIFDANSSGNNFVYPDYNAEINYSIGKDGFFAGAAIHHFLQPKSFMTMQVMETSLFKIFAQIAATLSLTRDNRPRYIHVCQ